MHTVHNTSNTTTFSLSEHTVHKPEMNSVGHLYSLSVQKAIHSHRNVTAYSLIKKAKKLIKKHFSVLCLCHISKVQYILDKESAAMLLVLLLQT